MIACVSFTCVCATRESVTKAVKQKLFGDGVKECHGPTKSAILVTHVDRMMLIRMYKMSCMTWMLLPA